MPGDARVDAKAAATVAAKVALLLAAVLLIIILLYRPISFGGSINVNNYPHSGVLATHASAEGYSTRLRPLSGPNITTTTVLLNGGRLREVGHAIVSQGEGARSGQPQVVSEHSDYPEYSTFQYYL